MKNLYIGHYKNENFTVLVRAKDESEARNLVEEYAEDAFYDSKTTCELTETTLEEAKNMVFDCDYVVQYDEGLDYVIYLDELEELITKEEAEARKFSTIKVIPAIERDGLDVRSLVIVLGTNEGVDIYKAIQDACKEYCLTAEGKRTYDGNCCSFNYGDFEAYVPNSICEKYGIKKMDSFIHEGEVDFNTQLVDESDIFPEEDEK